MTKSKLYELTPEHRAQLKPWADRWIANAMSTAPMTDEDKRLCEIAVNGMYDAANLTRPKHIVFVPSPFVLRVAGGLAAAAWYTSRNPTRAATSAATRAATSAATSAATWAATEAATRDATSGATTAATEDATWAATWAATWDATSAATWAATEAATRDATWDATEAATLDATRATEAEKTWYRFSCDIRAISESFNLGILGVSCANNAWDMWQGGNQWSSFDGYVSFFRYIAELDIDYSAWDHWETLSLHSGPRIIHPDFCMISDRPSILTVDDQNRPHCDDGPFCQWRDGSALYSVHGVRVPWDIVEHPETITAARIAKEENAEVKRVMVERMGPARWVVEMGLKPINTDDWGSLYQSDDATYVKVVNSTLNADGTADEYWLSVNRELRPIRRNPATGKIEYGQPQEMTALNAVASTFCMTGREYKAQLQYQS